MSVELDISVPPLVSNASSGRSWIAACSGQTTAPIQQFLEVTNLLLEQVQLNSTHLFRADILYDSASELCTVFQKEAALDGSKSVTEVSTNSQSSPLSLEPPDFDGYRLERSIIRRLIPRKPQLDNPLEQSCFMYREDTTNNIVNERREALVVYQPHCQSSKEMPWYHPNVSALAYLYSKHESGPATVSVHYLPFTDSLIPLPERLERTFQSLLKTMLRLLAMPQRDSEVVNAPSDDVTTMSLQPANLKDTILPQHIVQDTYSRLKQTYATDLISRWIESTEPSKHVFEDLSIAAFLIELWKTMYDKTSFPGFVDIACGNGVLVYILIKEGFRGEGFDARKRKTWSILNIEDCLHEKVCIPKPFLDVYKGTESLALDLQIHDGIFTPGTFIVSNHADELTCWTPILAKLSCPESPLPFLAIPCCSHALDGSRHRYSLKDINTSHALSKGDLSTIENGKTNGCDGDDGTSIDQQSATGDLKALRAAKQKMTGNDKSMYACLTRKTASLAQELGLDVELTLMRIPSTRNIGIVGNRKRCGAEDKDAEVLRDSSFPSSADVTAATSGDDLNTAREVEALIERECSCTGGLETSARTWIEKVKRLQAGQGRGKVNLNSHLNS